MAKLLFTSLLVSLFASSRGFCPQGFGGEQDFPKEWGIPQWPANIPPLQASMLRTVTMGGFVKKSLNQEYLEGPTKEFRIQGRESYWQTSGEYFMYYCRRFKKWRIAEISAFDQIKGGECFAFVSDAHPDRDIRDPSLITSWIEVENKEWVHRENAGVVKLGNLGDQLSAIDDDDDVDNEDEEEEEDQLQTTVMGSTDGNCSSTGDADIGSTFGPGEKKTSSCPVMPTVRKATKTVRKAVSSVGRWVRRLFPRLLGAPEDETSSTETSEDFEVSGE
eukprot:TRINITY_DN3920_c1_g1_i3.p1 TRINITY_DN3920_c1_g1~~TRINITY_DN3920_c1_g1_i3.p1  ORF type:complete len:288 (-),score=45.24 TRINITY_DN3920_c1_g1_i3:136-963(-)